MKWIGPFAAIFLLVAGVWLIAGPYRHARLKPAPGAETIELRVGDARGIVEHTTDSPRMFRVKLRDGYTSPDLDDQQVIAIFGPIVHGSATQVREPFEKWVFRLFNITSWTSFSWVALGALGQGVFAGRMIVQWLVSEKEKRSVVPPIFWWMSLAGGLALSVYFVWRQEIIGFIGQCTGITVYVRNLSLIMNASAQARSSQAETPSN